MFLFQEIRSLIFSLKGDAKGIEEWIKKHYFNITNDLEIDALQWAAKNGESYDILSINLNDNLKFQFYQAMLKY